MNSLETAKTVFIVEGDDAADCLNRELQATGTEIAIAEITSTDDSERNYTPHNDDAAKYEPLLSDAEANVEAATEHTPPLPDAEIGGIAHRYKAGTQEIVPEKIGIDVLDSFLPLVAGIPFAANESQRAYYVRSIANLLRLAKEQGFDIGRKNQAPHFFNGYFWELIDWETFPLFLQIVGERQGIPYLIAQDHQFAKKLVNQFISVARPILPTNDTPKINLRNGTLHFTEDEIELKPFDKRDGLAYQLHYDYDPSATAPLFKSFINRVLPNGAVRKLVFQNLGYIFLPKMNLERIMFFFGGGANGKSVLLNIIKALVGKEQCCEFSLEEITKEKYTRAQLGNHILNVCSEISARLRTDIFKKLVSREPLSARHPYGRPFDVKEYATSIFAMNELPSDVETTDAFFRRPLIIPFDVRIPNEEQDKNLARKIIANEMSGVLNFVVAGAKLLLREGDFDVPPEVENACKKFQHESDSIRIFLDENKYRPGVDEHILLRDMYESYKEHCKADRLSPVSKPKFSERLRKLGYEVKEVGKEKKTAVFLEKREE